MDILTYIDRVKANYSKQPEPVYNTKKYFTGGRVGFENGKKVKPRGLDSTRSKPGLDRMSDLLLKAYAEDDILHLANMPKQDTMNLSYFLAREDNIQYLSKKSGLSTEDIFDLLDDREAYLELEKRSISQTAGAETRLKPQREFL